MTASPEFDRQLGTLLDCDYPGLAGLSRTEFLGHVEPLRELVPVDTPSDGSTFAFVIVVKGELVPTVAAVERFSVDGRSGFTDMADELPGYRPIPGVDVPSSPAYLLTEVDTGRATLGVRPNDALPSITAAGRTPLTIDEGVALVTQFPDIFRAHNAFQALGSRAGNKRIPSFWVSKGAPRLGWCWAGNPHTWLGSGSAAARYGSG